MREGWKYERLGDICDFEGGSQPPKSEWISQFKEGYVRMLQIRDFTKSRNFEIEYVKMSKKLRLCKSNDILIGRYGASVGKILTGLEGAYNVAIIKTIPNEKLILKQYIKCYFESSLFQNYLLKICSFRTAQAGFNKEDIFNLQVPIPPLCEQERIVSLLDLEFAKIDAIKANAEKQLQDAKDLFQSALKDLLTPKEGWVEKSLKEIGKTQTGCTPSMSNKDFYNENYIPFVKPAEINYDGVGGINYKTQMLSKLGAKKGRIFKSDSIFMVCIGATIGKLGISNRDISCNQQINVLTPDEFYYSRFIYYAMLNPLFNNMVVSEGTSAQATLPIISKGKWELLKVKIPPYFEQQIIANRLDLLQNKIKKLQSNYEQTIILCNDLKQSILKDIFG